MVVAAMPLGTAGGTEGAAAPRSVTDNANDLIVPEGETYELGGCHTYKRSVQIMGTLMVKPYNGADESTGVLYLIAPNITIGGTGGIDAQGAGYGGGGGGTTYTSSVAGGKGGTGGNGGDGANGQSYYQGGGGGGGSNGGRGGAGYSAQPGVDGTATAGGAGGSCSWPGGAGGSGHGSGGGGGGCYYSGGGGGGGGGSGGADAKWYAGGNGAGQFAGKGATGGSWSPGQTGGNGGYGENKGNGDSTTDARVWKGSGGGGGGGTDYYYTGGAGGGGAGGGAVTLLADNAVNVNGYILVSGGAGGGGGSNYYTQYGYALAPGGGGAGGGVAIIAQRVIITGTIDATGRDSQKAVTTNGGTVKLLPGEVLQTAGTILAGRTYVNIRPKMEALISPLQNALVIRKPTFKWGMATDPEGDPITYELQLSSKADFSTISKRAPDIMETSYEFPTALQGTMYWRVRAVDACGGGGWSEVRKFTVDDKAPTSRVEALPEYVTSQEFAVSWKGEDTAGGSGIAAYTVYVQDGAAAPGVWLSMFKGTSAMFSGTEGHTYTFWSLATDLADNTELLVPEAKVSTTVDSVAPTSSISGIPQYQSKPNFLVSWSGRDTTSGVADFTVYLSIDGGDFKVWMDNTTETSAQYRGEDGHKYTFFVRARDFAGNQQDFPGSERHISTIVDGTAPATSFAPSAPFFGTSPTYIGGTSVITLDGRDNFAGVDKTYYIIDSRVQQEFSKGFRELQGGSHNITYWSVDPAGNEETRKTTWFWVDGDAPVTSLNFIGPNWTTENRVFVSAQTLITFDASDKGSGINRTVYNIDGSGYITYKGPFKLPKAGVHSLKYQTIDNLGYRDAEKNISIVMDIWTPSSVALAETTNSAQDILVELRGTDLESGLAAIYYRIVKLGEPAMNFVAGTNVTITALPDHSKDGNYTIEFYALDNVGNREETRKLEVVVDTQGSLTVNIKGSPSVSESAFRVAGKVEPGSNVTVNGLRVLVWPDGSFDYGMELKEGKNKIVVVSTDKAGNSVTTTKYVTYTKPQETGSLLPMIVAVAVIVAVVVVLMVVMRPRTASAR